MQSEPDVNAAPVLPGCSDVLLRIESLLLSLAAKHTGKPTLNAGAAFLDAARIVSRARRGDWPDSWNAV